MVVQWPDLLSGCSAVIMAVVVVQWPDLLCGSGDDGSGLICSVVVVMMVVA